MSNIVWIPAAIGAASALGVTLIKDFVLPRANARYSKQRTEHELFEDYLNPIVLSLEALMWRLNEILNQPGRGIYLQKEGSNSQYADYKRKSTVYRICATVAWFRAFERELLGVRLINRKSRDELRSALRKFQSVLADGKSVELEKYDRLVQLFNLESTVDSQRRDVIAIQIENILDDCLGQEKHAGLSAKPYAAQKETLEKIFCIIAGIDEIPLQTPFPTEAIERGVEILSFRQTWIYRDWQSAIGDEMLVEDDVSQRKFNVIGFGDFERIWDERPVWLTRISSLVLDLDVIVRDENDARMDQLKRIMITVAELIKNLLKEDARLAQAMPETYKKAVEIAA